MTHYSLLVWLTLKFDPLVLSGKIVVRQTRLCISYSSLPVKLWRRIVYPPERPPLTRTVRGSYLSSSYTVRPSFTLPSSTVPYVRGTPASTLKLEIIFTSSFGTSQSLSLTTLDRHEIFIVKHLYTHVMPLRWGSVHPWVVFTCEYTRFLVLELLTGETLSGLGVWGVYEESRTDLFTTISVCHFVIRRYFYLFNIDMC